MISVARILFFTFALYLGLAIATYYPTPVGWVEDRCIHRILQDGDDIVETNTGHVTITNRFDGNRRVTLKPANCRAYPTRPNNVTKSQRPQDYDGWLAYTTFNYPAGLDSFIGYFSVPNAPSQPPEVLYLFTGLQNVDWIPIVDPAPQVFDIIQPVLQYPGDGGNYWSVKSWYVTLDAGYIVSNEVRLNSGSNVFGNMTRLAGSTWYIGSTNAATGQTTSITVTRDRLLVQPWAYNTAECYGCDGCGCSCEPTNAVQFSKLALFAKGTQITPNWVIHASPTPQCNEVAHIQDPTSVSITFQN